MNNVPKRVAIVGLPGSGKSTFAIKLGKLLRIPVYHLDKYNFSADGNKRDREEFLEIQKSIIDQKSWIIEGCAITTLEMRFSRADTVIYFQIPRLICIWRICKRIFLNRPLCGDCLQAVNWELLKYTWNFSRDKGRVIEKLRKQYPDVNFLTFQNSTELDHYLETLAR